MIKTRSKDALFDYKYPHQCCVRPPAAVAPGSWLRPRLFGTQIEDTPNGTVRRWGFSNAGDLTDFVQKYGKFVVEV